MNKYQLLIVGVLITIAVILGYLIFSTKFQKLSLPVKESTNEGTGSGQQLIGRSDYESLTTDQKAVLAPPTGGSPEEIQKHLDLVSRLAVEAEFLDVAKCQAMPIVTRVKQGSEISIRNQDTVPHTVVFDEDHMYLIEPNQTKPIVADFGRGIGVYGFGCDKLAGAVGMISVVE